MSLELEVPFPVRLRIWGERACFTRLEMKVERFSYDVITPSAARGVIEAVYWKPQIVWRVDRIHVLNPIRFTSVRRNEVASAVNTTAARSAMKAGKGALGLFCDDDRQQRATTHLRDVDYVIEAHFELRDRSDSPAKHFDIVRRRAEKGQAFHQPYLGCREFPASFAWVGSHADIPTPAEALRGDRDLGFMLHDVDYDRDRAARFFRARMVDGVVDVPRWDSAEVVA